MDSTLQQYRTNFLQYATTGDTKYKTAYEAAQNALDTFIQNHPESEEKDDKKVYDKTKTIQGISSSSPLPSSPSQSWKYWAIGILGLISVGLMVL